MCCSTLIVKSGHSVVQDGLWAQVPSISLAGNRMEARAGVTALRATVRLSAYTEALSLKDYSKGLAALESDAKRLVAVRSLLKKRLKGCPALSDTKRWASSVL